MAPETERPDPGHDPATLQREIGHIAAEMERRADDLERRTEKLDRHVAEAEASRGDERDSSTAPTGDDEHAEGARPQPPEVPG